MDEVRFTKEEYAALPKEGWLPLIRSWCLRKDFTVQIFDHGVYRKSIPAKLPYRRGDPAKGEDPTAIYVVDSFLKMAGITPTSIPSS